MSEKKEIRFSLTTFLLILLIIGIISGLTTAIVMTIFIDNTKNEQVVVVNETKNEVVEEKEEVKENIALDGKVFSMDFNFLKLNNKEENVIYSPLSIRYALKMLEDGSNGITKEQINKLVTDRALTKYESNSNLSLANVLFVKDTFKDNIKSTYSSLLKTNYNAEVITDSFASSENVNKYVSDKTLGLLQNLLPEGPIAYEYLLINALGINLDWEEKFIEIDGYHVDYSHTDFGWYTAENVLKFNNFANKDNTISGMDIGASVFKYDVVNDLGEQNIRDIVSKAFEDWKNSDEYYADPMYEDPNYLPDFLDTYIKELKDYYGLVEKSTEFEYFVNDDVKVFAKDLKETNNTKLQYIGIMPINDDLKTFVENVNDDKVNELIGNLKSFDRSEDFEEGYITRVYGFIPKFSYEYELDLKKQLNTLGVTDVFDSEKADLSNIVDLENAYINNAVHKANIEFTQDGIKAAAATFIGGLGAGEPFDHRLEMKVKDIDLTFDKPYMYLIRDVETGEIWFAGTVYEPLDIEDEPEEYIGTYEYRY